MIIRALTIWLGIFIIAFVNGALREIVIKRFVDDPWAHHISVFTAILMIGSFCYITFDHLKVRTKKEANQIGGLWFILTVAVETVILNRWVSGLSWEEIIQTYNLLAGELWPIVLLTIAFLPRVLWHTKGQYKQRDTKPLI